MKSKFTISSVLAMSVAVGGLLLVESPLRPVSAQVSSLPDPNDFTNENNRKQDEQTRRDNASGANNADGDTYVNSKGEIRPKSELREFGGTVDVAPDGLEDETVRMQRLQAAGIDFAVLPSAEEAARLLNAKEGRSSRRSRSNTSATAMDSTDGFATEGTLANTGGEPWLMAVAGCLLAASAWWTRRKLA